MNKKEFSKLSKADIEILDEFEGVDREIALKLLQFRKPPSEALQKNLREIRAKNRATEADRSWKLRHGFTWALISITVLVILIAIPSVRATAARAFQWLEPGVTRVFSSPIIGSLQLEPPPLFTVRQPTNLPLGAVQTIVHYRSEVNLAVTEQIMQPPANPALAARTAVYDTEEPYLLTLYEAEEYYILLFQRLAQEGEPLPAGTPQSVDGEDASLSTADDVVFLSWIADKTWITLETNGDEASALEVANGLRVTYQPGSTPVDTSERAPLPLCDDADHVPDGIIFGRVSDQQYWGSVWINLFDRTEFPETVGSSISTEGVTEAMLYQRALDALSDPRTASQSLSADSTTTVETSDDEQCLSSDSDLFGYIVIEIWDEQVNLGFAGIGSELRDRAIDVLEQQLPE